MTGVPQLFDSRLRRLRRKRAAPLFGGFSFVADAAASELGERIAGTQRDFPRAVWCGAAAPPAAPRMPWICGDSTEGFVPPGGVVFEDEHLPFGRRALDLYASVLTLHAVNDLPGALTQIRQSLKPRGMFVAALFGGRTLQELRLCLAEAEIEIDGGLSPRVSPFVDVRDAGALLQRAGFTEPVADVDSIEVRYVHPLKLLADLRGMGETNVLSERRRRFLKRQVLGRASELYLRNFQGNDGRVAATFEVLYLTGWATANLP